MNYQTIDSSPALRRADLPGSLGRHGRRIQLGLPVILLFAFLLPAPPLVASTSSVSRTAPHAEVTVLDRARTRTRPLDDGYELAGAVRVTGLRQSGSLDLKGSPYAWVDAFDMNRVSGYAPVVAGKHQSGADLIVCRARMANGIHAGKLMLNSCLIPYAGKEVKLPASSCQVLIARGPLRWRSVDSVSWDDVLKSAIRAGDADGEPIFVGRVSIKDGVHPGKVHRRKMYLAWGGKEFTYAADYEILFPQ